MRSRRSLPTAFALVALLAASAAGLSGCAEPGAGDARQVADWIGAQPHVESAESSVSTDPWNHGVSFLVRVDPAISDEELTALAGAAERRARDAGWEHPSLNWYLGENQAFSELGGDATLAVFLGLRHDPRYLAVGARGNAPCGTFYCVTLASSEPAVLLGAVEHLLALAADAGGVQSNLEFRAVSADGLFAVTAEPDAPADAAVALWQRIAAEVPLAAADAWVVEPVGELPPTQTLEITVADSAAASTAQAVAENGGAVTLRVTTLDGATVPAESPATR